METTTNSDKLRKFIYEKFVDDKTYRGVALYNKNIIEINKQKLIIDNE